MANYDYFKQYVSEMERIKAKTAHDEHIIEFRAMCAKMISDAIPEIKQQCLEACRQEEKAGSSIEERKKPNIEFRFSIKDLEKQLKDAIKKAFK